MFHSISDKSISHPLSRAQDEGRHVVTTHNRNEVRISREGGPFLRLSLLLCAPPPLHLVPPLTHSSCKSLTCKSSLSSPARSLARPPKCTNAHSSQRLKVARSVALAPPLPQVKKVLAQSIKDGVIHASCFIRAIVKKESSRPQK